MKSVETLSFFLLVLDTLILPESRERNLRPGPVIEKNLMSPIKLGQQIFKFITKNNNNKIMTLLQTMILIAVSNITSEMLLILDFRLL